MKIQTWLNQSVTILKDVGIESARLDCLIILGYTLKKPRDWLLAHDDEILSNDEQTNLNKILTQRKSRIPLAYIIGSKEFYGRKFLVNESVLIPRFESEDIITLLLSLEKQTSVTLDIGTGSGVLAITAQLEIPETTMIATDISKSALIVAKQNAHNLKAPVQFYNADLLDLPKAVKPDVVLANLPYVPAELVTSEEITKEPSLALFSGVDGLNHYRTFWQQATLLPNKPRVIITESLKSQHTELELLAKNADYNLQKTLNLAQLFVRL